MAPPAQHDARPDARTEAHDGPRLTPRQTLQGLNLWSTNTSLWAVYAAITAGAITTGLALHLGADDAMIGILSAAPLAAQILQMLSPLFSERRRRRKPWCLTAYAAGASMWALVAVLPFVVAGRSAVWMLAVLVFAAGAAVALAAPAGLSWFTDLVPSDYRGRFMARQNSLGAAIGLLSGLAAGRFLDRFPVAQKSQAFCLLYFVAVLFGWLAMGAWSLTPEPARQAPKQAFSLRLYGLPFRDRNFRNLTLFVSARMVTVYLASPFFAVYMLQHVHLTYSQLAVYSSTVTIFMLLSNPLWGYLADKFGYKPVLRLSSFGIALNPLPWFCTTPHNYWWLVPFAQAIGGVSAAGLLLAQSNLMLKIAPEQNRTVYIGTYMGVTNLSAALGSMLGGLLATAIARLGDLDLFGWPVCNLQVVFLVSSLTRLLGLSILQRVREDQEVAARTLLRHVRSGNPLLTLWSLFRLQRSADPAAKLRATRGLANSGSALAVDELAKALGDSDREVRREAARGLGEIGDERATWPLIDAVLEPTGDIVEEAVEALGKIASERSLPALIELLADERPTVRKTVALALSRTGSQEAADALAAALEVEREPTVFLAMTEALSRIGAKPALHRLRQLLRRTRNDLARRQVANSISHILDPQSRFYGLLEADTMRQEQQVAGLLQTSRRRLSLRRLGLAATDRDLVGERLELALASFERQRYWECAAALREAASRAVRGYVEHHRPAHPPDAPIERRVGRLMADSEPLRLSYGFLSGVTRGHRQTLQREECLLAVFAFERVTNHLSLGFASNSE